MEYKELSTLYHMDASSSRASNSAVELQRRFNAPSTYDLKIDTQAGRLFVASPTDLSLLMETILRDESRAAELMQKLPPIAQAAVVRGLVLDEVVSTNAIEDIHSTRQQIEEALEALSEESLLYRRFKELAVLYLGLAGQDAKLPEAPSDIRSIYDLIMDGELSESQQPDGQLFRAQGVEITQGGVKVVHRGVEPESKIVEYLQAMISLTQREDVPRLVSAVASHYVFEYVHPFYDGNGRTGRYLLALFLSGVLSTPTVLSLSRAIAENKNVYYSAFSTVEKPLNKGEMTFFVLRMFELIRIAQDTTLTRLEENIQQFDAMAETCKSFFTANDLNTREQEIVFALAQFSLFGSVPGLSWTELSKYVGLEKQTVRKHAAHLEEKGLIYKVKQRPLRFALTEAAEKELGIA